MSEPVAISAAIELEAAPRGRSLWKDGYYRLKKDRFAVACFFVIVAYALVAILAKLGVIASSWADDLGASYAPPSTKSLAFIFGTDIFSRSVFYKTIQGTRIAMSVGFVVSAISIPFGVLMGSLAGYFGGWIDEIVVWFYTVLSSIPSILLQMAIAFVLGKGIFAIYMALSVTSWVGIARIIRGEFLKHKTRDYVTAAESLGAGHASRIFKHILPNVTHFIIINFSILFMSAIKSEVILSFLGLGVQGQPSWGLMIDDAKQELSRGVWWQLAAATGAMFVVVLAFNVLGDALRDALDPKIK